MLNHVLVFPLNLHIEFALNRHSGPILSQSRNARLSVCLFVCLFAQSDAVFFFKGLPPSVSLPGNG